MSGRLVGSHLIRVDIFPGSNPWDGWWYRLTWGDGHIETGACDGGNPLLWGNALIDVCSDPRSDPWDPHWSWDLEHRRYTRQRLAVTVA
jgi:hypothetical protein